MPKESGHLFCDWSGAERAWMNLLGRFACKQIDLKKKIQNFENLSRETLLCYHEKFGKYIMKNLKNLRSNMKNVQTLRKIFKTRQQIWKTWKYNEKSEKHDENLKT